jgi:hypothetical protein
MENEECKRGGQSPLERGRRDSDGGVARSAPPFASNPNFSQLSTPRHRFAEPLFGPRPHPLRGIASGGVYFLSLKRLAISRGDLPKSPLERGRRASDGGVARSAPPSRTTTILPFASTPRY